MEQIPLFTNNQEPLTPVEVIIDPFKDKAKKPETESFPPSFGVEAIDAYFDNDKGSWMPIYPADDASAMYKQH
jgi:hypothetical protein